MAGSMRFDTRRASRLAYLIEKLKGLRESLERAGSFSDAVKYSVEMCRTFENSEIYPNICLPYEATFKDGTRRSKYIEYTGDIVLTERSGVKDTDEWSLRESYYQIQLSYCRALNELQDSIHPWVASAINYHEGDIIVTANAYNLLDLTEAQVYACSRLRKLDQKLQSLGPEIENGGL